LFIDYSAPKLDYFELIDISSPSSTTPVICDVFYVIFNICILFFDDTCAYVISFSFMFILLQ